MKTTLKSWLPFAVMITLLCGVIYSVTKEMNHMMANDISAQIAEDIADRLEKGVPPESLIGANVDVQKSIAPFAIVFDDQGNVMASSAVLAGKKIAPPTELIKNAEVKAEEHRLTWQPAADVRVAIAIVPVMGPDKKAHGAVVAGHSLRETDARESRLGNLVFIGWIFTLVVTFGAVWFTKRG